MIDVSPFIQVTDFVRNLTVTAYKNLADFEIGFSDNKMSNPIYALIRSVNKNREYYNEIYFSQASTYRNVYLKIYDYIAGSYNEEYGYEVRAGFYSSYFSGDMGDIIISLDTPPYWFAYLVNEGYIWGYYVTVDNGVVWRGWICKSRPFFSCDIIVSFSEYGIRPSAKALGEIVTFKLGRQEIEVGPIFFHHYEQDASDKKRVRVFGWTEFPEGDPQLVQEIYFD